MYFKGWAKNSFVDYPSKIATTVFTAGCNFRCPFCHNGDLVLEGNYLPSVSEDEILEFLDKRSKVIDAVCITGGEPTLMKNDLILFMNKVKSKGYLIKLDTNGYLPEALEEILQTGYVDYLAMDIKNSPERYAETVGLKSFDFSKIEKSINLIRNSGIPYEFRTTVSKTYHTEKDILEIANLIKGSSKYALQQYRKSDKQVGKDIEIKSYSNEIMLHFKNIIEPYFDKVEIRGL